MAAPTSSFGGVLEIDPWLNKLAIDVTSVSLFGGGVLGSQTVGALIGVDDTTFSFSGLLAGTYTLAVESDVDPTFGFWNQPVGYVGSIATVASRSVPEPGGLALIGIGLIGPAALRHKR
ncbi:MAG TPA: PEP-CTERM sorting domain-containing protein [Burkholderiaceae bacterium]|nr:PEP-CTERM sorting domain-containing protein [Burkholderiaceae bacterium]